MAGRMLGHAGRSRGQGAGSLSAEPRMPLKQRRIVIHLISVKQRASVFSHLPSRRGAGSLTVPSRTILPDAEARRNPNPPRGNRFSWRHTSSRPSASSRHRPQEGLQGPPVERARLPLVAQRAALLRGLDRVGKRPHDIREEVVDVV